MTLSIRDLAIQIGTDRVVHVDALDVPAGGRLGLVGESGSGKTLTAMSIAGLLAPEIRVNGSVQLDGRELVGRADRSMARIRGAEIGVVFQDPLRALNPMMRIGRQIAEAVRLGNRPISGAEIRSRVVELVDQVGLSGVEGVTRRYPHQLSGGQRQRTLIAVAIASRPKLLIADEPTTALDVTVQEGILDLLLELSTTRRMALLFVSHDLGVVRRVSERVAVMYGGRLVETGTARSVLERSHHRYTEALIAASPWLTGPTERAELIGRPLDAIPGSVPEFGQFPEGCGFRDRCTHAIDRCAERPPATTTSDDHTFTCWNPAHMREADLHDIRT
ncbi:ABC transporter ATP-binding protein [Qaidamihabitans albus]|uniref:ABC transporter ATP-binding protein n=1 Tax=Qaidamihabitans albus TaxID=2795733 RepID=UPI0018F1ABFE|nr:ABC transporter ATP-binding protein [Qaidamihabitans albus]